MPNTEPYKGPDSLANYNYAEFTAENFEPLMRFEQGPPPGSLLRDFSFISLDSGESVSMQEICRRHPLSVFEFGSVT